FPKTSVRRREPMLLRAPKRQFQVVADVVGKCCYWHPPKRPDRPSTSTRLRGKAAGRLVTPICGRGRPGARQAAARLRRSPRRPVGTSERRAAEGWLFHRQCVPSAHLVSRVPLRKQ